VCTPPFPGIGVSKLDGVGVISMRDMPRGTNPFRHASGKSKLYHPTHIRKEDLAEVPEPVKRMLNDFFSPHDGVYYIPREGLNTIDISYVGRGGGALGTQAPVVGPGLSPNAPCGCPRPPRRPPSPPPPSSLQILLESLGRPQPHGVEAVRL
jgi:hypothetical protein